MELFKISSGIYKVKNFNFIIKCQSGHLINMILGIKFCGASRPEPEIKLNFN